MLAAAPAMVMVISSSAFLDGQPIPARHLGADRNLSPPLSWRGVPPGALSLALTWGKDFCFRTQFSLGPPRKKNEEGDDGAAAIEACPDD